MSAFLEKDKVISGLPCLSEFYNHYYAMIDSVLPCPARKKSGIIDLLDEGCKQVADIDNESAMLINRFLKLCADFRTHDFHLDPTRVYTDTRNAWLPLLLLGTNWRETVSALFDFRLHEAMDKARFIRLRPVATGSNLTLTLTICQEIKGIGEKEYLQYENNIKIPYKLKSSYDVDSGVIRFLGTFCIKDEFLEKPEEGIAFLNGSIPYWLEFLLNLDAIDIIDIDYPIFGCELSGIRDIISLTLAIPFCNLSLRKNGESEIQKAWQQVCSLLESPGSAVHIILSKMSEEWFPLIEHIIKSIVERDIDGHYAFSKSSNELNGNDVYRNRERLLLQRYISLPRSTIMRVDQEEYRRVNSLFQISDEQASNCSITPCPEFVLPVGSGISYHILKRIGNVNYLDSVVDMFLVHIQEIVQHLKTTITDISTTAAEKSIFVRSSVQQNDKEIKRKGIETSRHLCQLLLEIMSDNLLLVKDAFRFSIDIVHLSHSHSLNWLTEKECASTLVHSVAQALIKILINGKDKSDRTKALCGILYLLCIDDVIPDTESKGNLDDEFALAHIIRSLSKQADVSDEIRKWATQFYSSADANLYPDMQEAVIRQLNSYLNVVENRC